MQHKTHTIIPGIHPKSGGQLCPPSIAPPKKLRTQAERILERFSMTPPEMARMLDRAPSTVYRWTYPLDEGGTGGIVPTAALRELSRIARVNGVLMRAEDFNPSPLE